MADSAVRTSGDVSEHPRSRPSSSMAEDGSLSSSRSRPQTPRDLGIKPKIYNTPESLTVEEAYEKIYSCSSRSRYRRRATATPAAAPAPSGKGNNNDLFRLVEDGIIKVSEDKKEIDPESIASYKRLTGLLSSELEIEPLNDPSIASYEKLTGIPTSDLDIDREPLSSPSVASYEKLTGIPTDLDIDRESPTGNPSIASYEKLTGIPTSDFDREPSNNQTATTLSKNIENIDCLPVSITPQKKTNLTPSPQKNIKSPGIKSPPGKGSDRESTKLPEDGKLVDRGRQQKSGKTPNRGITTPQKPVGPKQDLPVSSTSSRPANNGTTTSLPRKARALSPSPMRGVKKSSPSSFRSALSRNESPASSSGQSTATQKPAFSTGFKTPVNSKIPLALTPKYTPKFCKTFKATPRPLKAPLKPENDPKAVVEPVKLSPMPSLTVPQAKVTVAEPPKSTPKTAATKPVPKIEPTKPTPKTDPTSTKPTPKIEPTSAKPTPKPEPTSTKPTPKTEPTTPPKSIMKTSALIKRQPLSVSATSPRSTGSYLERHGKMELAKKPDNITERIKRRVKIDVPVSPKQSSASANLSSDPLAEDKPMVTKSDTIPMSKADADQPQARGPQPDPPSNSLMPDANINMDENKTLCRVDSVPGISEQVTPTLYDSEEEELKFGNNNSIKISPLPVPTIVATVQENVDKKKAIASKSNVTVVDVKDTTPTPGVMTPCRFNVAGCREMIAPGTPREEEHNRKCAFRPIPCIFNHNCKAMVPHHGFLLHLQSHFLTPNFTKYLTTTVYLHEETFQLNSDTWMPKWLRIREYDANFFLMLKRSKGAIPGVNEGCWLCWVWMMGSQEEASQFFYEIDVFKEDRKISGTFTTQSIRSSPADIVATKSCLSFTDQVAKHIASIGDTVVSDFFIDVFISKKPSSTCSTPASCTGEYLFPI